MTPNEFNMIKAVWRRAQWPIIIVSVLALGGWIVLIGLIIWALHPALAFVLTILALVSIGIPFWFIDNAIDWVNKTPLPLKVTESFGFFFSPETQAIVRTHLKFEGYTYGSLGSLIDTQVRIMQKREENEVRAQHERNLTRH